MFFNTPNLVVVCLNENSNIIKAAINHNYIIDYSVYGNII
jgi:hypothetical protein